ncbi:MAG: MFS transporter [Bdellovibrionota bacterium]
MKSNKLMLLFPIFFVLYEFTVYLANDMIMPGMLEVVKYFSASNTFVPVSLTAFLLGGASLQIILGPLSDRFGRRKVLLFGATYFLFATVFILISNSMEQFLYARFLQGMGLCFIGTVGYASIQELYEERKAIKIISLMAMISLIAPLAGPLLGGLYIQFFHWRGIFIIIGILALIALIGLFMYMPETVHLKLNSKNKPEKNADLSLLPKFNFLGCINNYILILKNTKFLLGAFAISLSAGPLIAWIAISPVILMEKAKLSSVYYGICQIPIFGALIFGNIILQKIIKKVQLNRIIYFGSFFIIFGLILCGILPIIFGESYFNIVIPFTIYCFGIALSNSTLTRLTLYSSPIAKGSVSAILSLISTLVYALSTYAMAFVYKNQSNVDFGLFCLFTGVIFTPVVVLFLIKEDRKGFVYEN